MKLLCKVGFCVALSLFALASGRAETVQGFDPARLQRLDAFFQSYVDRGQVAGSVLFVARDGHIVRLKAFGQQDIATGKPMRTDTIFRVASMSKAVTSVAVMMLYEEGKFMLHDPIGKYIPAFANSVVAVPPPAGAPAGTKFVTVPAKRPIQIRDLLSQTSGLSYGSGLAADQYKQANLYGWFFANHDETIGEAIDRLGTLPLNAQPGESWVYGFSTDVLGRLVEVASGMPLDKFIEERICRPLGMTDTSFFLPPDKASRLATLYGMVDGKLVADTSAEQDYYVKGPRKCFSGGAGLLTTAADYGRFLQMLLNGGELDGVRLLSPKTVELMHVNHTGDKYRRDTHAFGLGFWVNDGPGVVGEVSSEGSYGWGSAYFPQYIVDPKERLVMFFLTQLKPAGSVDLNMKYKVLMYQALVK